MEQNRNDITDQHVNTGLLKCINMFEWKTWRGGFKHVSDWCIIMSDFKTDPVLKTKLISKLVY